MARQPEIGNVQLYPNRVLRPTDRNGYVLKFYCPILGKRIRRSCSTRTRRDAKRIQRECQQRLLSGRYVESGGAITVAAEQIIKAAKTVQVLAGGEGLAWSECSEQYRNRMQSRMRKKSFVDTTYRLDVAERIFRLMDLREEDDNGPLLSTCTTLTSLEYLQDALLAGVESRKGTRSPNTVNSIMASIMAFVRYCRDHEWIDRIPPLRKIDVDEVMKGRPISGEEFDRMLEVTPTIVGIGVTPSWRFLLKVLWESGFRMQDLMRFSWDDLDQIYPVWPRLKSQHPTIVIPSSQKNRKNEEIPMLPGLVELLKGVPKKERSGWVVDPQPIEFTMKGQSDWFMPMHKDLSALLPKYSNCSIATACGVSEQTIRKWLKQYDLVREDRAEAGKALPQQLIAKLEQNALRKGSHRRQVKERMSVERVGRIIGDIGKQAGIVVRTTSVNGKKQIKFASAHDLRRGCAQRLINAGVSAETLKVIMRHREFSTTERYYGATKRAQSAATELVAKLLPGSCELTSLAESEITQLNPEEVRKLRSLLNS